MRLFSYCIPHDHGAAPNPFWGVCTLTICKPGIRRVAQVGDWVVGVGSVNVGGKDYSGKLVYVMKVTKRLLFGTEFLESKRITKRNAVRTKCEHTSRSNI